MSHYFIFFWGVFVFHTEAAARNMIKQPPNGPNIIITFLPLTIATNTACFVNKSFFRSQFAVEVRIIRPPRI